MPANARSFPSIFHLIQLTIIPVSILIGTGKITQSYRHLQVHVFVKLFNTNTLILRSPWKFWQILTDEANRQGFSCFTVSIHIGEEKLTNCVPYLPKFFSIKIFSTGSYQGPVHISLVALGRCQSTQPDWESLGHDDLCHNTSPSQPTGRLR